MRRHRCAGPLAAALTVFLCLMEPGEGAHAEPPLANNAAAATETKNEAKNSTTTTAADKSAAGVASSIEILLEEISQLKLELVPESLLQAGQQKAAAAAMGQPEAVAVAAAEPKQIKARATSSEEELKLKQQQRLKLMQWMKPLEQPQQPQQQPHQQPPEVKRQPARQLSVCDKAPAIGTLGYRMLCPPHRAPSAPKPELIGSMIANYATAGELHQREPAGAVAAADALEFAARRSEAHALALGEPAGRHGDELQRLKTLLDRLIQIGNFRPLSSDGAPEARRR